MGRQGLFCLKICSNLWSSKLLQIWFLPLEVRKERQGSWFQVANLCQVAFSAGKHDNQIFERSLFEADACPLYHSTVVMYIIKDDFALFWYILIFCIIVLKPASMLCTFLANSFRWWEHKLHKRRRCGIRLTTSELLDPSLPSTRCPREHCSGKSGPPVRPHLVLLTPMGIDETQQRVQNPNARPLLWRRDSGILPTCELMSKCIYGLTPLRSSQHIHVYMTLILYMLIGLRDFESHCFQGYREHKHHTKCPLRCTWRWWQCGLRAELRLCESWAMVECLNQEKHCLFLQSRSSQSMSKLQIWHAEEEWAQATGR